MAIGLDEIKTTGKLVFSLTRGDERTTRTIDIAYPVTNTSDDTLQDLVNAANAKYTSSVDSMNIFVQPSNWRDTNVAEEQWITTQVSYEIVTVTTTPITPETPVTVGSAQENQQDQQG